MTFNRIGLIAAVLVAILTVSAGCGELPPEGQDGGGLFGPRETPTVPATATQTPSYLTQETPFATPTITQPPTGTPTPTAAPEIEYFSIYNDSLTFKYNVISYAFDLRYPPMVIDTIVFPELVEREVEKTSSYGTKETIKFTKLVPNELSEFKLTVYDKNTGDIVAEQGYGKVFSDFDETKTLFIRIPGYYQIEMTGNLVDVDISIRVAEENIE